MVGTRAGAFSLINYHGKNEKNKMEKNEENPVNHRIMYK